MPQSTCGRERDKFAKSSAPGAFSPPAFSCPWAASATNMVKVNFALLGGLRLQTDPGEPVPLSTKKAGALLAYLALHPGQAQARPKLATLLWGDHSEVQARDSLRNALSLLRKALSG